MTPNFDITSGGIRVMWGLYGALLAKGQIVYVNAKFENNDFIAVYPEIVQGNPLGAKHVVRYILNKPGVMSSGGRVGPTEFDASDKLYYFSRLFGEAKNDDGYMFLPILNLHLFKDQHKERTQKAVFFGKGLEYANLFAEPKHPSSAIVIDRSFAQNQQALADLLNECEVLYCYDPVTAMTELARLCGCRIVMINPIYTKEQFKAYEPGMNGISWDKDEEIPLDVKGFTKHYKDLSVEFARKLDFFIEDTQKL